MIYGNRIIINEFDQDIGRWVLPKHDNKVIDWVDFIPQETLFWRKRVWDKIGKQLDVSFNCFDWDLLLRFKSVNSKFLHIPYFLSGFRVHNNQKTIVDIKSNGVNEMNILRKRTFGYIPSQVKLKKIYLYLLNILSQT